MPFKTNEEQRAHISQGEKHVETWKVEEADALDELKRAQTALKANPTQPALQSLEKRLTEKYDNVKKAREQQEMALQAAKRAFGWTD